MSEVKLNLKGKTALISGANRGIGKEILIALLENGVAKVYAGARNPDTLNELVTEYGNRIVPVSLDVTDMDSIEAATKQIDDLDILINNAGVFSVGSIFSETANSSLKENWKVNLCGVLKLSNSVVSHLKKTSEAAIVNISSLAGLGNMPMAATYSISKVALHSLTQGMRAELINTNTLVMGVYPGPIDTDMAAGLEMEKDSPKNVANSIIKGLINGIEDIFPDTMSREAGLIYAKNPKEIEKQFSTFVAWNN